MRSSTTSRHSNGHSGRPSPDPAAPGREADEAGGTSVVLVRMPKMGISVSEGTIVEWRKGVGERVEADETIAEVTTDKVDVEIPAPASGIVGRLLAEEGDTVAVGEPIAEIGGPPAAAPAERTVTAAEEEASPDPDEVDRSGFYSPVVQRMAAKHAIDLATVDGTGVGGRDPQEGCARSAGARQGRRAPPTLHTESPYRPDEPAPAPANGNGNGGGRTRADVADAGARSQSTWSRACERRRIARRSSRSRCPRSARKREAQRSSLERRGVQADAARLRRRGDGRGARASTRG